VEESDDESGSDLYTEEEDDDESDDDDVSEDSPGRLKDLDGLSLKQENVLPNPALAVPLPVLEARMRELGIQAFGSKEACEAESAKLMRKNSKPQRQRHSEEESSSLSRHNTTRISGGNMDNIEEAINLSIHSRTIYNSSNKGDNARVKY
jgi:hypothetical protein